MVFTANGTESMVSDTAVEMAEQICRTFQHHDRGARDEAVEALASVDRRQFEQLTDAAARRASTAYVDALWAKDELEAEYIEDGEVIRAGLATADWSPVEEHLATRAAVVDMDARYAAKSVEAWRNHKTGGDYWTPIQEAQVYELRAALQDPEYPHKPKYGRSGHGPEAARYAAAIELHDMHSDGSWTQARDLMVPYYERILLERLAPEDSSAGEPSGDSFATEAPDDGPATEAFDD